MHVVVVATPPPPVPFVQLSSTKQAKRRLQRAGYRVRVGQRTHNPDGFCEPRMVMRASPSGSLMPGRLVTLFVYEPPKPTNDLSDRETVGGYGKPVRAR